MKTDQKSTDDDPRFEKTCDQDTTLSFHRLREVWDARLRISRSKFYEIVKEGDLNIVDVHGARRIRSDELDRFIRSCPSAAISKRGGC